MCNSLLTTKVHTGERITLPGPLHVPRIEQQHFFSIHLATPGPPFLTQASTWAISFPTAALLTSCPTASTAAASPNSTTRAFFVTRTCWDRRHQDSVSALLAMDHFFGIWTICANVHTDNFFIFTDKG